MILVPFKKGQRFWTIDEAKEDADNEDNHDGFLVCKDAACSDACSDVMPSFLDVTKRSLSMSMPLSDGTKPRTDKLKSDLHTNKLSATTLRDQYNFAILKPVTNNIEKQEQRATLKKNAITNINPRHQLDFITVCRINNEHRQSIPDSNPSERNTTMVQYKIKPCLLSFCTTAPIL